MADVYGNEGGGSSKKKILLFLLGLLLGLMIGGGVAATVSKDNNKNNESTQSTRNDPEQDRSTLVNAESTPSTRTLLTQYTSLLIEASREGVDAPSDEATAAKLALEGATTNLVESLNNNQTIDEDLNALNESVLEYAGGARSTGDERDKVDKAFETLVEDLQNEFKVQNTTEFESQVTSLKNTVIEGIRDFVQKDYAAAYSKQLQAEKEINLLFSNLQKKQ